MAVTPSVPSAFSFIGSSRKRARPIRFRDDSETNVVLATPPLLSTPCTCACVPPRESLREPVPHRTVIVPDTGAARATIILHVFGTLS